ncbi:MAG: DNA mismatch repair protein [Polyangiaceae bacterium]|nr:DNA mismatch repair protein [Polyangiaceae bacterium]
MDAAELPDLLHPVPVRRLDVDETRTAVTMAFAGAAGGLFHEALEKATLPSSTWQPEAFANDLFLSRFVAGCLRPSAAGRERTPCLAHLVQLLTHPPRDRAVVDHRRAILAELDASPDRRAALEGVYAALWRLRTLLEDAGGTRDWDPVRRHLDILGRLEEVIEAMVGFETCRSGLAALGCYAERVRASEPYRSMAELLRYDERLATLRLDVSIGADGRIRSFRILSVEENQANAFASPPWRRWLAKVELFARGYKFGDGEVMARLVDAVFSGLEVEVVALIQLFGDLELYLGALAFADRARAAGLAVCLPELVEPDTPRRLEALFNPLLLMSGIQPVPCDLVTSHHAATVLVTGPNSGGKTRLLQSLGLAQVLAQAGLFVCARGGGVALTSGLVVSLIQETKADQAEGRLGVELVRIRALFECLPPGAMVLLDELCSGTNPSEGEEIFELVVGMLQRLRPQAFITTHFLAFAARLERERSIPELEFLQVELGADRRATYQFVPGVATTSLAGHAAQRLGVTGEQLSSLIEQTLQRWRGPPAGE